MNTYLLEDHRTDGLRSGEGSVVELRDGRLLLHYSHFEGGKDHDPACIAARISSDGGCTWGERTVFHSRPEGSLNVMGASLLRLADGRLGSIVSIKWSNDRCVPYWQTSSDEGETWSAPRCVTETSDYFVVNNDRLIQMRDGTLVLPFARHGNLQQDDVRLRAALNAACGVFYSRDGGETWVDGTHTVKHTPEIFRLPFYQSAKQQEHPELREVLDRRFGVFQEPGLVELSDGRVRMHVRSLYAIYDTVTADLSGPWGPCRVLEGFNTPCGPQTIRRLPDGKRLVMLYNDRGETPWGDETFNYRTPLAVAVSDDEGETWQRLGALTDESLNYCYFSLLFFDQGQRFIISAYESAFNHQPDGSVRRRNLASLKIWTGPTSLFRQERIS